PLEDRRRLGVGHHADQPLLVGKAKVFEGLRGEGALQDPEHPQLLRVIEPAEHAGEVGGEPAVEHLAERRPAAADQPLPDLGRGELLDHDPARPPPFGSPPRAPLTHDAERTGAFRNVWKMTQYRSVSRRRLASCSSEASASRANRSRTSEKP